MGREELVEVQTAAAAAAEPLQFLDEPIISSPRLTLEK